MKRCDEGYPCVSCGVYVEDIRESDLYLRFILGEILLEELHLHPERHIRCHPETAQYIIHPDFLAVDCPGPFGKENLSPMDRKTLEESTTNAWLRLQAIPTLGIALPEYPLSQMDH